VRAEQVAEAVLEGAPDEAGVAGRGAGADLGRVEDGHVPAGLGEVQGGDQPGDAGADDRDGGAEGLAQAELAEVPGSRRLHAGEQRDRVIAAVGDHGSAAVVAACPAVPREPLVGRRRTVHEARCGNGRLASP
jgi:hypothetical protein